MMKNMTLRILATLMALMMVMGLAACGGNDDVESSSAPVSADKSVSQVELSAPESSEVDSSDTTTTSSEGDVDSTTTTTTTTTIRTKRTVKTDTAKAKTWDEIKAEIPSDASGKTLTIYDWNPTSEVPGMDKVNKNFTKETGINIKYTIVTHRSYFTKITAEVAAKNAPDAVRLQNINRNNLVNLQPMNNLGFDFSDPAWDETTMEAYTFNGNLYGVNMVDSPYYDPYAVYYNKRLIDTYGLDDPYELWKDGEWTWDALWDICKEFLKQSDGNDFIGLSTMDGLEYQLAYNKPAITYDKKTNTFSHNLEDEKFIKSFQLYANYYDKGYISRSLTNNDAFNAGNLLFNISHTIAARDGSSYFKEIRSEGVVACVPLPALTEGAQDYQLLQEVQAFGIPKTAKNPTLVPYYLRYYFDVDNYDMDNFYNVDNAAEVLKYIQSKNPSIDYNGMVMTSETTGFDVATFLDELKVGGAANVKMKLDSYVPTVEAAMKEAQTFLASL